MRVLIIGASPKPQRYAYLALKRLQETGHDPILFNPTATVDTIDGFPVYRAFADIPGPIDTITLYLGSARLNAIIEDLIALSPRRIIANPGTENSALEKASKQAGIDYLEACTLILLGSQQF